MTESHWLLLIGIILIPFAYFAFRKPEKFLIGSKARMWVKLIGEAKTIKMVRYVSSPLCLGLGIFLIMKGSNGL